MGKSVVSVVVSVLVAIGLCSRRVDAGLIVSAIGPGTGPNLHVPCQDADML